MSMEYFLALDGIPGATTLAQFKNQLELVSFNFGASSAVITSGGGGGTSVSRTSTAPLVFVKAVDVASPHLFIAALSGTHIAHGILTAVEAGNTPTQLFQITLSAVLVTGYHLNATPEGAQENVTLSFSKIEWTGLPPEPLSLSVVSTVGWDVTKNVKL